MLGLDAAGKTAILRQIAHAEVETAFPTVGFAMESVKVATRHKVVSLSSATVGGREKMRPLFRHFYHNSTALIWVLDATEADECRLQITHSEFLRAVLDDEMKGKPILIFLNKIDMPGAMSIAAAAAKFDLHSIRDREWFIQPCCALNQEGIFEGLGWLTSACKKLQSTASEVQANSVISKSKHGFAEKAMGITSKASENYAASAADTESTADAESTAETESSGF